MPPHPWPLRRADFDVLGHVNNAIAWSALEQEAARIAPHAHIDAAEVEYRRAIQEGGELGVVSDRRGDLVGAWLVDRAGDAVVAAVLRLTGEET